MRFTLKAGEWYAMELFGSEFGAGVRHCSPIEVQGVSPFVKGDRRFELQFYHANYPAGVREKTYVVETVERSRHYLLGRVQESDRQLLLLNLSADWLQQNFGTREGADEGRVTGDMRDISSSMDDGDSEQNNSDAPLEFAEFHWKADVLAQHGLPDVGFPVPVSAFDEILAGDLTVDFPYLLYWMQIYTANGDADWLACEEAMTRLAELVTTRPSQESMAVQSDDWWLEAGPVNLLADIVTIQRQEKLVAAIQPRDDGRLRVALFQPLDARAISLLTCLGQRPGPSGEVSMRPNNWEYALDSSAGMGQIYADQRGECYLSRWEIGLGLSKDGTKLEDWYDQRKMVAIEPNCVVKQIDLYAIMSLMHGMA